MISFCLAVLIACLLHNEGAATTAATEIVGQFCLLKGGYLQYLRNTKLEDGEVRADRPHAKKCTACERWSMERRNSKIALASLCERGKYLQARADGSVGVGSTMDLWTWHGKQGESSSFMSANGSWLSANKNGTVYAAKERSFDGLWIVPLASRLWPAQIGPRCLKTAHRTFLRPTIRKRNLTDDGIEEIVVATTHKCTKCAQWHFEERHGKVGIKSLCSHKYLSAATNYSLDLVDKPVENALWSSLSNLHDDDSYSFESAHGTWLHVSLNGAANLQPDHNAISKFRLVVQFTEPINASQTAPPTTHTTSQASTARSKTTQLADDQVVIFLILAALATWLIISSASAYGISMYCKEKRAARQRKHLADYSRVSNQ